MIADDLKHLRCAEAIHQNVFRHLRHVAAISCFVKHHVDVGQRGPHRLVVLQIPLQKFGILMDPCRFSILMSLWFEIIQNTNLPTLPYKEINNM